MSGEWKKMKEIKIPNTPKCIDEVVALIIRDNPELSNKLFEVDQNSEEFNNFIKSYETLILSINSFENAMLNLKK